MKRLNRLFILAISLTITSLPFVSTAQHDPAATLSETEYEFLQTKLQLDKPVHERKASYQISANTQINNHAGRVYIHKQLSAEEIALTVLAPQDLTAMAYFGFSVDLDGEVAVVGAPGGGSKRTGSAYVFRKQGDVWKKTAKLLANDGDIRDDFGYSVKIDGNFIYIGAPGADDKYEDTGAVYVFEQMTQDVWMQVEKLLPEDQKSIAFFGKYIEDAGHTVLVGAEIFDAGHLDNNQAFAYVNKSGYFHRELELESSEEIYRYIASYGTRDKEVDGDTAMKNQIAKDVISADEIAVDIAGTKHIDLEE